MNTYVITTDSVTTKVQASSADEAAAKFADSEKLQGITSERQLVQWAEDLGGWCNVNELAE